MAAPVNNIAATFAASRAFPSPPATAAMSSSSSAPATASVRPISISWNPHSALRRSHRSSLLGLPGPRPSALPNTLLRPAPPPAIIKIGDRLPDATLSYLDETGTVRSVSVINLTRGRKAVILAVPGAFAPPPRPRWREGGGGFMAPEVLVKRAAEMREKGGGGAGAVVVVCVAVNDVYVMRAWGEQLGAAEGGVLMLSDPDAEVATALGMAVDMRGGAEGFGVRSEGYCMVAVNGVVTAMFVNNNPDCGHVSASTAAGFDDVLKVL